VYITNHKNMNIDKPWPLLKCRNKEKFAKQNVFVNLKIMKA